MTFFARGLSSGGITLDEAMQTGLTEAELKTGSFLTILDGRRHLAKQ